MLGFVFCQAVIELCFSGLICAGRIGEIRAAILAIPVLNMRIAGAVRIGLVIKVFVLASGGIGARRGIGVRRAAGDCEGYGVADGVSQCFIN